MNKNEPFDFFNKIVDKCIERNIDFYINFDYNHGFISITGNMKEISEESINKIDEIIEKGGTK